MLTERLEAEYGKNNPIFLDEIFKAMPEYSQQSIYRMIASAVKEKQLMKFEQGVYYLPKIMEFGLAIPSVERVVDKKYVRNENETFGVYGRWVMELNFDLSTQVPNTIEVITNNTSRAIREIEMRGRRVVLRKSRLPITKENAEAYTVLELFSMMDMREYSKRVRQSVFEYIKEKNITKESLMKLAYAFPAKAMRNLAIGGVLYEVV